MVNQLTGRLTLFMSAKGQRQRPWRREEPGGSRDGDRSMSFKGHCRHREAIRTQTYPALADCRHCKWTGLCVESSAFLNVHWSVCGVTKTWKPAHQYLCHRLIVTNVYCVGPVLPATEEQEGQLTVENWGRWGSTQRLEIKAKLRKRFKLWSF